MKIKYQNEQKYSECSLVVALNAAYSLGEKEISLNSEEYERLVDLTGARHGSCIDVTKAYEYLRLEYVDVKPEWNSIWFSMNKNLPISVGVNIKPYGLHNIVIVKIKSNNEKGRYDLKIPNLKRYTNKKMWIHWYDFEKMIDVRNNIGPNFEFFRIFYINKFYINLKLKNRG